MQPDSFMKKYYATSSEWNILIRILCWDYANMIKGTESTESSNRERTQSTKADYASIW